MALGQILFNISNLGVPNQKANQRLGTFDVLFLALPFRVSQCYRQFPRVPGVGRRSSSIRMKIMSNTPEWLHTKLDQSKICLLDFASRLNWKNGNDKLYQFIQLSDLSQRRSIMVAQLFGWGHWLGFPPLNRIIGGMQFSSVANIMQDPSSNF